MAQLPPKVPNVVPQNQHHQEPWQEFMHPHHQQHQQHGPQNPPWVEEFMEFSAAKRGVHRRSVSESSVAFVEAGPVPFFHPPAVSGRSAKNNVEDNNDGEFERFNDEQFMSMFSNNELGGPSSSNPSSTSDHNSTNDDQKRETTTSRREGEGREKAEEAESACKTDKEEGQGQAQAQAQAQDGGEGSHIDKGGNNVATATTSGNNTGGVDHEQQPVVDPKRVKRILANRQSAQRSRVRKLQYISELERSVTALQSEVSALSPRVAFLDHQRMILNVDNSTLKAKIAALTQDKIFKDAHQEAMKREIERLRQVYYQQNLNKTESIVPPTSTSSLLPTIAQPPPQPDTMTNENKHHNC